jgi:hypothetical protein
MKRAIMRVWVEEYEEGDKPVRQYGRAYEFDNFAALAKAIVGIDPRSTVLGSASLVFEERSNG